MYSLIALFVFVCHSVFSMGFSCSHLCLSVCLFLSFLLSVCLFACSFVSFFVSFFVFLCVSLSVCCFLRLFTSSFVFFVCLFLCLFPKVGAKTKGPRFSPAVGSSCHISACSCLLLYLGFLQSFLTLFLAFLECFWNPVRPRATRIKAKEEPCREARKTESNPKPTSQRCQKNVEAKPEQAQSNPK